MTRRSVTPRLRRRRFDPPCCICCAAPALLPSVKATTRQPGGDSPFRNAPAAGFSGTLPDRSIQVAVWNQDAGLVAPRDEDKVVGVASRGLAPPALSAVQGSSHRLHCLPTEAPRAACAVCRPDRPAWVNPSSRFRSLRLLLGREGAEEVGRWPDRPTQVAA